MNSLHSGLIQPAKTLSIVHDYKLADMFCQDVKFWGYWQTDIFMSINKTCSEFVQGLLPHFPHLVAKNICLDLLECLQEPQKGNSLVPSSLQVLLENMEVIQDRRALWACNKRMLICFNSLLSKKVPAYAPSRPW